MNSEISLAPLQSSLSCSHPLQLFMGVPHLRMLVILLLLLVHLLVAAVLR